MAQNGGTRGGTFHGEMGRCRKKNGKDQGENSPKQAETRADSLALVDYNSHKWRELVPSGRLVCRCHDVSLWCCYACFVLLRFRLSAFVEAAALRSIVLRYASAPIATRVFFCTISAFSLYGEYVVRSFLPNGLFLTCDHGLDF